MVKWTVTKEGKITSFQQIYPYAVTWAYLYFLHYFNYFYTIYLQFHSSVSNRCLDGPTYPSSLLSLLCILFVHVFIALFQYLAMSSST